MKDCPECGKRAACVDSRIGALGATRRRYHCACGTKFTTAEFLVCVGDARSGHHNLIDRFMSEKTKAAKRDVLASLIGLLSEDSANEASKP